MTWTCKCYDCGSLEKLTLTKRLVREADEEAGGCTQTMNLCPECIHGAKINGVYIEEVTDECMI